jgi:hypothetical protein
MDRIYHQCQDVRDSLVFDTVYLSQNMNIKHNPNGKHQTSSGEKILSLPGISDAIEIVNDSAWVRSVDKAIGIGGEGEFGEKPRQLINTSTAEALDDFLELEAVKMFSDDNFDAWLELLAFEAGPKTAEF